MTSEPQHVEESLKKRALTVKDQTKWLSLAIALLVVVASLGLALTHLLAKSAPERSSAPAPPNTFRATDAQLANLRVETVKEARFHDVEVTDGKIALNMDRVTPVFSPYSGRVIRPLISIGEFVRQGARLVQIDATEYTQVQSDFRNSQAQVKLAQINEARKHAAFDSKGGSLQDWQQAQVDLANAENALAAARNRLHVFGSTDAQIEAIGNAKDLDGVTYIIAPISGTVTDRQVGPGQFVQAGSSTPLYTIGDVSTVWLVANVREVDAPKIHRGQSIEVHVLALPDEVLSSKIDAIGASVDPITHHVPVRAALENRAGLLKPEMFASFSIVGGNDALAPAVSSNAIVYEGDTARVWVVENKNDIGLREIHVGRSNDQVVEVVDGLKVGERIVTRGSLFIDRAARGD